MVDFENARKDFPILEKGMVYLDSAATSQKPASVINAVNEYYKNYNANIHRGIYKISELATEKYVESKKLAAKFINAENYEQIVYVRNATEALNLVALSWGERNIKQGDVILTTKMEHHSNMVPWQLLAIRKGAKLEYVDIKDKAELDMEDLEEKLTHSPKILAFTHVSNVLGTINDAKGITKLAHRAGAKVVVDAAQSVPHMPVDVKEIDCDFMAFSSHKMLGPSGIGVLYAKRNLLEEMEPVLGGGDMIRTVSFEKSTWNDLPWKFEAGTPNIEGAIGFGAAVKYLSEMGMNNIREHEKAITKYAMEKLNGISNVQVYGPTVENTEKRAGVVSFGIRGVHPHDISSIFDEENVAIRSGHHCAMPLVTSVLNEPATSRMSFYLYNNEKDVDAALNAINKVKRIFKIS